MSGMLFTSRKDESPTVSRPIHFYTKDSLNFSHDKEKLYGELYHKSCPELPPRPAPRSRRRRSLVLFTLNALLSLTSIILYAVVVPLWEKNFEHTRFPLHGDWTDAFMLMPLSISFLSCVYLVFYMVRRQRQISSRRHLLLPDKVARRTTHGPDPFYMILLSATVLLIETPLLVLATTNSLARAFRNGPPPTETRQRLTVCTVNNMLTRSCIPILYRIGELQLGAAITAGLTCSIWIVVLINSARSHYHSRKEARLRKEQRRRRRDARRKACEHTQEHERRSAPKHNANDSHSRHHDILRLNDPTLKPASVARRPRPRNDGYNIAPLKISKRAPPVHSSTNVAAAAAGFGSLVSPTPPSKYYNPTLKPSHSRLLYLV